MSKELAPLEETLEGYRSVRTENDPYSLIAYCADAVAEAIMKIPEEMLDMPEHLLKRQATPTATDYALRVSFWREYEQTMTLGKPKITSLRVYVGICHERYFYGKFLGNPAKVAWMILPLQSYKKEMAAILHRGTERLWELIQMDIRLPAKKKGAKRRVDARLAEILLKTIEKVENRVHGMAVQRQESKTLRVNVGGNHGSPRLTAAIETEAQLMSRIRQLEGELSDGAPKGNDRDDALVVDGEDLSADLSQSAPSAVRSDLPGGVSGQDAEDPGLPQQGQPDRKDR